jgi:peptidoglycan/xylan/chitin deacetylase (PgdA/CDA1 family)
LARRVHAFLVVALALVPGAWPGHASDETTRNAETIRWALPRGQVASPAELEARGWSYCALTFDDGPDVGTEAVLAAVRQAGVVATWFPVGEQARVFPDLVREFAALGNEIGNHSERHVDMGGMGKAVAMADLRRANAALASAGAVPRVFRPPYGSFGPGLGEAAAELGMETVRWTVDTLDWKLRKPDAVAAAVRREIAPGAVVLMHARRLESAAAVPGVVAAMRERGCRLVTVSEWLAYARGRPAPGE